MLYKNSKRKIRLQRYKKFNYLIASLLLSRIVPCGILGHATCEEAPVLC